MYCAKFSSAAILFCVCALVVCSPVTAQVFDEGEVTFGKLAIFCYGKQVGKKISIVIDDSLKLTLDVGTTVHVVTLPKGLHKIRAIGAKQTAHAKVFIQADRVLCIDVKARNVVRQVPVRDASVRATGRTTMTAHFENVKITKETEYLTEDKFGMKLSDLPYDPTLKEVNGMQAKMPKQPEPVTKSAVVILVFPDGKGWEHNVPGVYAQYRSAALTLWRGSERSAILVRSVQKVPIFRRVYPGVYRAAISCHLGQKQTRQSKQTYGPNDEVEFTLKIGEKEWCIVYVEWKGKGTLRYNVLDNPQARLLNDIRKHGASSLTERTRRLKMEAIQVKQALASLTRNGFVDQGVRLTQKGKAIAKEEW